MIYLRTYKLKNGSRHQIRLYTTWKNIRQRCYNGELPYYPNWGGRGISVCKEWRDDFLSFRRWALASGYKKGLTIDRMNNDGDYEPSNCRWATQQQQQEQRRLRKDAKLCYKDAENIRKDNRTLAQIASDYGVCFQMISHIKNNKCWTVDRYVGKVPL